jgi:hypothetical protein
MNTNNIQAALIEVARSLMVKMASIASSNGMPPRVATRINRATSANPVTKSGNAYTVSVKVDMSEDAAPMAAMYEYGIGAYPIPKTGETFMAFPKEKWPQYVPPPPAPDVFVFYKVTHPAVEAKPYIKPAVEQNRVEVKRLLGKAFVESVIVRGTTKYEIRVM